MIKKKAKKKSFADQLEARMRQEYLPAQLSTVLGEILSIEFNAKWRKTPEGIKAAQLEHGYTEEELALVMEKQQEHKTALEIKKTFIKKLIDRS